MRRGPVTPARSRGSAAPPTSPARTNHSTRRRIAFKSATEKIQTPIAYQDADEFKQWWDADSARLAAVVKRIGRVEAK